MKQILKRSRSQVRESNRRRLATSRRLRPRIEPLEDRRLLAVDINNFTFNFSDASGGGEASVEHVQEFRLLAGSVQGFVDHDHSGGITSGDEFQSYSVVRISQLLDMAGGGLAADTYGSTASDTHEITVRLAFHGHQITNNSYVVDGIDVFEVYFDSNFDADGNNVGGFTGSSFADLRTFVDSRLGGAIQTGMLGGPSGGTNTGPTAPDGTIDLVVEIFDSLSAILGEPNKAFQLDAAGNPLGTGMTLLFDVVDANNNAAPPRSPLGGLNGGEVAGTNPAGGYADIFSAFGLGGVQLPNGTIVSMFDNKDGDAVPRVFNFSFATRSDGSIGSLVEEQEQQLATIGDFIWHDTNANGIQDGGETGVAGATVELFDGLDALVGTQITPASGLYLFTDLTPDDYYVKVTPPTGYFFSPKDAGGDAIDSDANIITGVMDTTTLTSGEVDRTWDAGLYQLASLGDFVWHDLNANGIQDADEPGIPNVTVNLKNSGGVVIATTTTDTNGLYAFTGLMPGNYSVQFVQPGSFSQISPPNVGSDATDSDGLLTAQVTLASGDNNTTLDQGLYNLASLGDFVWHDLDADGIQDAGEPGIPNVTVNLKNSGGVVIATTTTNAAGIYGFSNLIPGAYSVQFVQPGGFSGVSPSNIGANDAVDSDGVLPTLTTATTTLASGQTDPTLDQGFYKLTPNIDIEKTTDGDPNGNSTDSDYDNEDAPNGPGVPILTPGTTVTWTYRVENKGNVPFTFAQVVVRDDNGTPGNPDDDFTPTLVGSSDVGNDLILSPGEIWIYTATGTVENLSTPSGAPINFTLGGSNSALDGMDGNIRTFTAGGVSVNASAFSRDKSSGAWSKAWLGRFSGGLGVTDSSEGDGSSNLHTVDNVGRDNYVLFEFSENVVVDSAYLGYVVNDSDMTVWIGTITNAFSSHVILSDAVLLSLGFTEVNLTTLTGARAADLNADNRSGNVLVIAAYTDDASPEDRFKINTLTVRQPETGIYRNKAVVTVNGYPNLTDSDLSHYTNPQAPPATAAIDIEKYVKQVTQQSGGEGLTPGYWKQSHHYSSWVGHTRYQSYNEVFGVNDPGTPTLLSALGRGGGGYKALGRHAVAALLNASHPNIEYAYTKAHVIAMVQSAYATGNFEAIKNLLAKENEKGADLSSGGAIIATPGYGDDADSTPGPTFPVGSTILFTFVVSNPGDVPLKNVTVTDDNATSSIPGDDFSPSPVLSGGFNIGDDDSDGELDPGEEWIYTATRVVVSGQFTNSAKVTGTPVGGGANVTDTDAANWNAPSPSGSISGYKFNDRNADGEWDKNGLDDCWGNSDDEVTLANWKVFADYDEDGVLDPDEPWAVTNSSGYYKINGVQPGTWQINEVMQSGWIRTTDDWVVTLASGESKTNINFGNFCGNIVMDCDTATVGFWKGTNGQKLIKKLNQGGTYGTNVYVLGNWLACNFPRMYGNLAGKSNAQIASHFYNLACDSSKQLDAQVMATVLAVYVTDTDWAGGNYAAYYGFNVSNIGVKNDYYNIGCNGAAFGVNNDAALTVWDILQRTNARASNNVLWYGYSSTIKNMAKVVYTGINTSGGIT